jgi:hypothetical protein
MQQSNKQVGHQSLISLELHDLAELLVKHHDLHEGLYDLAFEFQIAVGAIGPSPESVLPGAMIGIKGVGLMKAEKNGPQTVDAAKVNPVKKPGRKK